MTLGRLGKSASTPVAPLPGSSLSARPGPCVAQSPPAARDSPLLSACGFWMLSSGSFPFAEERREVEVSHMPGAGQVSTGWKTAARASLALTLSMAGGLRMYTPPLPRLHSGGSNRDAWPSHAPLGTHIRCPLV